jgi:DNA helicase-2/ATP-dependent DNA helicase PcrA
MSPRKALQQIAKGRVHLSGVSKIVERYKTVSKRLSKLRECSAEDLVNSLFPDGEEESQLLRNSILPALEEDAELEPAKILERLRNLITQPEMPESADFVRIMSLQKSKGLTSKVVIVLGCVEGLMPSINPKEPQSEQDEVLSEQRRLFYVAMTRPTDILVLSSFLTLDNKLAYKIGARVRFGRGGKGHTIASRFLGELGEVTPAPKSGIAWQEDDYE